ncbi:MAG: phosphoribosylformylglycinamidine synthase subunit PurL [Frankiaceae bacterium]|jgi:phosphoribosylformylglycinamidine synthase|nr:phosphoribosylformylglycinamidine synthase subunit PurL [Frankiaceae bacterium]
MSEQPYAELGLKDDEYARICEILGRKPSDTELAMYSVMWSEHCSYKSSKVHLRQFGEKAPETDVLLVGIGENAGVVDVGDGLAVTFKVESHNHPSYVEPYQGAATGVGGIVRDILTMGARPIAVMDSLRFGEIDHPDTRRLVGGVVAGVGGYGNCLGLPNIGGEVVFDPTYAGNPLVNALCIGVLRHEQIQLARAEGVGNKVVLLGAKTGRDGIGGVSVLASATFNEEGGPSKRPSVQVGDPFTEKVVIECCLELFDRGLVTGIQDLGGAGLSCATSETASHGGSGMLVDLDLVPLREPSMTPVEVITSESQERMLAIVRPGDVDDVLALCERWGVLATVIGEVTDTGRLQVRWHGDVVVDVPPASLADEGPVYERPLARPADQDALQADVPDALARPRTGAELAETLLRLAGSPNLASRRWVTEQYDRYVLGGTVLAMPHDSGVVRLTDDSDRGVALALDGNGRYARLDPYAGAQLALAEAYRNVSVSGARPLAVTNCLNFGSPEDPEVMWQFAEATRGLADGCRELGVPVTGGNVSFYNQTGATAINPTPVVGVLGVIDDVNLRVPSGFTRVGDVVVLLGETYDELGGSEWAWVVHGHLGGRPPKPRLAAERALSAALRTAAADGLLSSAHDVSDGGLGQTLVEAALLHGIGATVTLAGDPFVALFSESAARAVVTCADADVDRLLEIAAEFDLAVTRLGRTGGDTLDVTEQFTTPLDRLRDVHEATLPKHLS